MNNNEAHRIDHIILGTADLGRGIKEFERLSGVKAAPGGIHPGGTHNALAALDEGRYLEILAPNPEAELDPKMAFLTELQGLTPIGWALRSANISESRKQLLGAGLNVTDIRNGSRQLPGNKLLKWKTISITKPWIAEAPFLIEWLPGAPHPSIEAPAGCCLNSMQIAGPQAALLKKIFTCLNISIQTTDEKEARIRISLNTPKEQLHLGGEHV
jgi:hypothetical protein